MAVAIETTEILKDYFDGVLARADHHAKEVEEVALPLMGAVIWRSCGEIQVREVKEGYGNVLWFTTNSNGSGYNRYALSYNHSTRKIEMRDRSQKGDVLYEFDNSVSSGRILEIFRYL